MTVTAFLIGIALLVTFYALLEALGKWHWIVPVVLMLGGAYCIGRIIENAMKPTPKKIPWEVRK